MFQILIVEDDKELSQLFQNVLEKNGYQVKSASDGALALETRSSSSFISTDILPIQADAVPKVRFSNASLSIQLALHDTDHDIQKLLYQKYL